MRAEDRRRKTEYRKLLVLCFLCACAVVGASATTWYADNGLGDNGFDGRGQVITNGSGPKRNIANAIAAASSGDVVSVAAGLYQESQWIPGTKTMTFPSGPVTIVNYDPGQTDTDNDNIPDWWMLKYFGHPTGQTSDQSCAGCYYNGNPLTNLEEYRRGLDPTNTCPALVPYTANCQTNIVCKAVKWAGDFVVGLTNFADALLIQDGGVLSNTGIGYVGYETSSSNNSVLVTGAGSVWSNEYDLYFGFSGAGNSMVISNGGRVVVHSYAYVGYWASSSNNSVLVIDPGSIWDSGPSLELGLLGGGNSLVISNGGEVIGGSSAVGVSGGSNSAVVTGAGSVWRNSSVLTVGAHTANNSLVICDGGEVDSGGAEVAGAASNSVVVTGVGSVWNDSEGLNVSCEYGGNSLVISNGGQIIADGPLLLGSDYLGSSLLISSGGRLVTDGGTIGSDEDGEDIALVTGTGSVWSCSGQLSIGDSSGNNSLVISNGGKVISGSGLMGSDLLSEHDPMNYAVVTGPGSVWSNGAGLFVGYYNREGPESSGPATLILANGGMLVSTQLVVGYNHGPAINRVTLDGGTLIGTNASRTGLLEVDGGTLTINNGTCTVDTLRLESGTNAALVFNNSTLKTERAILANGAKLWFALGTNSHPVEADGNMVLGAYLNITDGGGFTGGTYTLFTYGGTLTYDGVILGATPNPDPTLSGLPSGSAVVTNASCYLDMGVPGQINLRESLIELTRTSEDAVFLRWNSESNAIYRIEFTDDSSTNAVWKVLHDEYPSQGSNTFWLDTGDYLQNPAIENPKNVSYRRYRVDYLGTNSVTPPTVNVVFPSDGMELSGQVTVTVATVSSALPILSSYLYVDGQQMYSSDDGSNFVINTCEWPNGSHILFATAIGQSGLSGPLDSPPVDVAYAASAYVPVTFNNFISQVAFSQPFFEPALGQTQQVIAAFAANASWTLQIQNVYGNTVRNASGTGASMVFNWDGTGDGGTTIPVGVYYYVVSVQATGGSFASSTESSSTTAPTRPPTVPGEGSVGTVGVAYYDFPISSYPKEKGGPFDPPLNGLPFFDHVALNGSYGPYYGTSLPEAPYIANDFVATMQDHCWKVGFNENLPSGRFRNVDLRSGRLGGNERFGDVNLGLFIAHGGYGSTVDFNPDARGTLQTNLLSDNPVDASEPWVRLSECGFGGNLRWMALLPCNTLRDINFYDMVDGGGLPITTNLHLLCGSTTRAVATDRFGESWAPKLFDRGFSPGGYYIPAETVEHAWYLGARASYCYYHVTETVIFRVVGWDNCFGDTLQDYADSTSGTLLWTESEVAPCQ